MHRLRQSGAAFAVALALAACANKSQMDARARSDAGLTRGRDSGTSKPATPCDAGPGYAGPDTLTSFSHLSATVVDLDGQPAPKVTAQACGVNICVNGTTNDQGAVVIDQTAEMIRPAFKYGGGQSYAKFALPLGGTRSIDLDVGAQRTVAFDAPELGASLTPGTHATSRGVTVVLASNAAVAIDPFDYDTPALKNFRAAEIPMAKAPAAVDASLGLSILVALTPTGTTLCPRAKFSTPNSPGWPAGSRVEFFLHGVEVGENFAPYGGWAKVSDGAVTEDGSAVETDDAGGLPIISVVGVRLAR
jgi:hypothetical protein